MRKTILIFAAFAFVATVAASQAQASERFVIVANLSDAKRPHAQIDVSIDTTSQPGGRVLISFDAFREDGTFITSFEVLTN